MQVKNRIFPYPVLNNNEFLSNFLNASFTLNYEEAENDDYYVLKGVSFNTDSPIINKLFDEKKISVVCIIECSYTVVRKSFRLDKDTAIDIPLFKQDFRDRVDISMFAYANDSFVFSSDEVDDDYQGIDFNIDKYDIIAVNDGYYVYFRHQDIEESLPKSIFSIINDHEIKDGAYNVDFNSASKITISLSDDDYKNYKTIYTAPNYKEVFFNILLIPTLTEALTKCIAMAKGDEISELDDICDTYKWFASILGAYEKENKSKLKKDEFTKMSPVYLSQELLGKPLGKSLSRLIDEMNKINDGGYSNED